MSRSLFPAYAAYFFLGVHQAVMQRAELLTRLIIYGTLLVMFGAIYAVMPLQELGVPGLTSAQMLWYFALTECIIVSNPGLSAFGRMIAEGDLTAMMLRPCSVFGQFFARFTGMYLTRVVALFVVALLVLPTILSAPVPFSISQLPLLILFVVLGVVMISLLACILGSIEVLGPYSTPWNWIISKFLFTFGGLFFPVAFFPPFAQKIANLTPFPSMIFTPASIAFAPESDALWHGLAMQFFWLVIFLIASVVVERKVLRYVMKNGD